jgi:hypothetical protein
MQDNLVSLRQHTRSSVSAPARVISYAWGEKYLEQLLTLALPAMLAPGNLPHLASTLSCEVVLLIEEREWLRVNNHPSVQRIRRLCPVNLFGLDDLISAKDKYGMSLTYALHRGFGDLADAATDCFLFFLNADFVAADGSFRQVLSHLLSGDRLIAAPSYCVIAEKVSRELYRRIDANAGTLPISKRELAKLALHNLHNTVRGKTVNQARFHLRQMDQFYWRFDGDTLLGHQMPVAIVGMRPERFVAEPNSYWDHGLIREFCPNAEPRVLGDSDDFMMVELREKEVAEDQIVFGPFRPREAGERMIGWVTPYQRGFAKNPLTLHAKDLPENVEHGRAKLRACVRETLSYSPQVLPSHVDHPQWNYHLAEFTEARHQHLSARLGTLTADWPPPTMPLIDRTWWDMDGLRKGHERRRAELERMRDRHMEIMQKMVTQVSLDAEKEREKLSGQFVEEFSAITAAPKPAGPFFTAKLENLADDEAAKQESRLEARVLGKFQKQFEVVHKDLERRIAQLNNALHAVYQHYERQLSTLDQRAENEIAAVRRQYKRLIQKRILSAAIPHVRIRGERNGGSADGNPLTRTLKTVRDKIGRETRFRLYRSPLRAIRRIVADAKARGAQNVLTIGNGPGIVESIVAEFPGVHASVSTIGVLTGNLRSAIDQALRFDLCVWDMSADELLDFSAHFDIVEFCMNAGGRVIGFHWNTDRVEFAVEDIHAPDETPIHTYVASVSPFVAGCERLRTVAMTRGIFAVSGWLLRSAVRSPQILLASRLDPSRPNGRPSARLRTITTITVEAMVVGECRGETAAMLERPHSSRHFA